MLFILAKPLFLEKASHMRIPPQTSDIFTFLSKGHFISLNSKDPMQTHLYEVISSHEGSLRDYFAVIDLHLHRGNGYYYFSRPERGESLEERMEKVMRQLDLLSFLLAYNPRFGPGLGFSAKEVWEQCQRKPDLMKRLDKLSLRPAGASSEEKLRQVLRLLEKDTFLEADTDGHYRVLSAFDYLLQLIDRIELRYDQQYSLS